jgi:hypothetical protein
MRQEAQAPQLRHASGMSRTTLRYAIEQLGDAERQQWMA